MQRRFYVAVLTLMAAAIPSQAASLNIMPLGDSITFGVGSEATGGYRQYLFNNLSGANTVDMVGTLADPGSASFDNDHFGISGIEADDANAASDSSGLIFQLKDGGTGVLQQLNTAGTTPDVILLHIGTNSRSTDITKVTRSAREEAAISKLTRLVTYLDAELDAIGATNTKIVVAQIIPSAFKQGDVTGSTDPLDTASQSTLSLMWQYNFLTNSGVSDRGIPGMIGALDSGISNRLLTTDMFRINISDLNTTLLASQLGITEGDLLTAIDPDSTGYVDWVLDYNELTNTFGTTPTRNTNLWADELHPTDMGYAIMAQVWENTLIDNGLADAIPEPASLALLAIGGIAMLGRRSRRSADQG